MLRNPFPLLIPCQNYTLRFKDWWLCKRKKGKKIINRENKGIKELMILKFEGKKYKLFSEE